MSRRRFAFRRGTDAVRAGKMAQRMQSETRARPAYCFLVFGSQLGGGHGESVVVELGSGECSQSKPKRVASFCH